MLTESNPKKWYSRKHVNTAAFALFVIGIWTAVVFLPTLPILSLSLSVVMGVLIGVFIGYKKGALIGFKRKRALWGLLIGFWIASWGYSLCIFFLSLRTPTFGDAIYSDFMIIFLVVALVTLPLAWFGRLKVPSDAKILVVTWLIYLFIIFPFAISCIGDFNVRADTSPPEVIGVTVMHKNYDDELGYSMLVEALDGKSSCWIHVSESFYYEHDWGSSCEIIVRKGALGYSWVEGYVD